MKTLTVEQADDLVSSDNRIWWETYAKTLVSFRPGRGGNTQWKRNGYFNRAWYWRDRHGKRHQGNWGTIKRIEISDDGLFRL